MWAWDGHSIGADTYGLYAGSIASPAVSDCSDCENGQHTRKRADSWQVTESVRSERVADV